MKDIKTIADYTVFKKLASALWQKEYFYHGAAIMIGAGFSRCSAQSGDQHIKMPIWWDYAKLLKSELQSNVDDPLRLAEEYYAFFGKEALHDLIKQQLNDLAWQPGDLTLNLLKLPWSEVLTTNWDTLLERASMQIYERNYSIVTKPEDLSSRLSPRIVKLHGTINATTDFIFTQEDFRRYPEKYAAFVNFARQVFIENELCLLGFSGDDPNFLQWAGWVRDNLAGHSRRIYLVGALNLSATKRKYLQSINIAPIDLAELVKEFDDDNLKHTRATEIFINALYEHKPIPAYEWEPQQVSRTSFAEGEHERVYNDLPFAAKLLEEKIPKLEIDRDTYPGWIVAPELTRFKLFEQISDPYPSSKNIQLMKAGERERLLYEIVWRNRLSYSPPNLDLLEDFLRVCDPTIPCSLTKKQQLEVAIYLLNPAFFEFIPKSFNFNLEQKLLNIIESNADFHEDALNEVNYYYSLKFRDELNYERLEFFSNEIKITNPEWALKKAALLCELGQFDDAETLVSNAYDERMLQLRQQSNSIFIRSRLAWSHYLMFAIKRLKNSESIEPNIFTKMYEEFLCDPFDIIKSIVKDIDKLVEDQINDNKIEPSFKPGNYRDKHNTIRFRNGVRAWLVAIGLQNHIGLPMRWSSGFSMGIFSSIARKIVQLNEFSTRSKMLLAIRTADSDTSEVIKEVLSRIEIAKLSIEDVNFLATICEQGIDYWLLQFNFNEEFASVKIRIFTEVLARLSIRVDSDKAKQFFKRGCQLATLPVASDIRLHEPLSNLMTHSLSAISQIDQQELLLEALNFPTVFEVDDRLNRWANPIIENLANYKRSGNLAFDKRVAELIDSIEPNDEKSSYVLSRIKPLVDFDVLNEEEKQKLCIKLWDENSTYESFPQVGFYPHAFLSLPSKDHQKVKSLLSSYLYENDNCYENSVIASIASIAIDENCKMLPSRDQALVLFDRLTMWRIGDKLDPLGFNESELLYKIRWINYALVQSILPMFELEDFSQENFRKLQSFCEENDTVRILPALTFFTKNASFVDIIHSLIKNNFYQADNKRVGWAAEAIYTWRKIDEISPIVNQLVTRLIYSININQTNLVSILSIVYRLLNFKYLSNNDKELLSETLPIFFDSTSYELINEKSIVGANISIIRKLCVMLGDNLLKNGMESTELLRIIEEAKTDPLPEVRYWFQD